MDLSVQMGPPVYVTVDGNTRKVDLRVADYPDLASIMWNGDEDKGLAQPRVGRAAVITDFAEVQPFYDAWLAAAPEEPPPEEDVSA